MSDTAEVVKFERETFPGFLGETLAEPGCERVDLCIQCGTCSANCAFTEHMDLTPRKIIALTRAGFKREVLSSQTLWLCTSCYGCTARCPKEIKITDLMYALKRRALREGMAPKRGVVPAMIRNFSRMSESLGRVNESRLAGITFMQTRPMQAIGMWRLGLGLMRTGRFHFLSPKVRQRGQLQSILHGVGAHVGGKGDGAR